MRKTHTGGELRKEDTGKTVTLMGWVNRQRTHGGIIFLDLRDRAGITQIVCDPSVSKEAYEIAEDVRPEYVLAVTGVVRERPAGAHNPNLKTGDIEVVAHQIEVLNASRVPPFPISDNVNVDEATRLRYRYLDLRRERLQKNLLLRDEIVSYTRKYLHERDFVEIETPILVKETPGGAREHLVPSRFHEGCFYALPQSPQQFKQLLMVAGFERYFQIARCFRDEAFRANRQLEFTQIDIEMSFVDQDDILEMDEGLVRGIVEDVLGRTFDKVPFPRLTFAQAMDMYGTDKPDTRFGLPITNIADLAGQSSFEVFHKTLAEGGQVRAIRAPGLAGYTRRELDELTKFAQARGAKGLATLAITPEGFRSPIAKFFEESTLRAIAERLKAEVGDLILIVADKSYDTTVTVLGELRLEIGRRLNLMDPNKLSFLWIVEMPMFEWDADENIWRSKHHHFTSPVDEDLAILESDPGKVRAKQYDLVGNGEELGGGSIRIHRRDLQERIFRIIGMSDAEAKEMFGHMLEAFEYGTPPHGGIAHGLDRMMMVLTGEENIREVIAFPKTQSAMDLMLGAPSPVEARRLAELHLQVLPEQKSKKANAPREN